MNRIEELRFKKGCRLKQDPHLGWIVLIPEGIVKLNASGAELLKKIWRPASTQTSGLANPSSVSILDLEHIGTEEEIRLFLSGLVKVGVLEVSGPRKSLGPSKGSSLCKEFI